MTIAQVAAGLAAAVALAGAWLVAAWALGWRVVPVRVARRERAGAGRALRPVGWLMSAAAGGCAWALTGWPALGVGAAAAAVGLPVMFGAGSRADREIERVEAVEEWTRRLADVLAIGVGLEQAIQTAARTAPGAIASEVSTLAARIAARMPTESALRGFADDLADPTADLVVAALILASRRRGPGVAAALTAIAESVAEEVAARRRVEADRAKPRTTARAVTLITLVIIGAGAMNRSYTEPYSSALGQAVLATTLAFFGAALWWMHGMTVTSAPARILARREVLQ